MRPHLDILANYAATAIHSALTIERQLEIVEPFALIGLMTGGFLHTLTNEMSGARGFWDNLASMELPERARERLSRLGDSLKAIDRLCKDRLGFDPRAKTQFERVDLNLLLDATWLEIAKGWHLSNIEVRKNYDPSHPLILGSRTQIETTIRMLIQNSLEALATVEKKKTRAISLRTRLWPDSQRVSLSVADSGCGMNAEIKRQAFRPLFTTKDTGTGLGLAVVRHVAKSHNAPIKLFSMVGWGTSVSIMFSGEAGK